MEKMNFNFPSVCFHVEKILEVSDVCDKHKSYKVQWAASWVSEVHLVGCNDLLQQFHHKSLGIASNYTTLSDGFNCCETAREPEFKKNNEQLPGTISTETSIEENILNTGTLYNNDNNNGPIASRSVEYIEPYSGLSIVGIKSEQLDQRDFDINTSVPSSEVNLSTKYESEVESRDNLLDDLFGKGNDTIEGMSSDSGNDSAPVQSLLNIDLAEITEITSKSPDHEDNLKLISLETSCFEKSLGEYDPKSDPEMLIDITEMQPVHSSTDIETLNQKHDTVSIEVTNDDVETGLRHLLARINEKSLSSSVSVSNHDNLRVKAKLTKSYSDSTESPFTNVGPRDDVTMTSHVPQQRHTTLLSEMVDERGKCVPYTCQHCNENIKTITKYLDHLNFFHDIIACRICFEEFHDKSTCQLHQKEAHNLECPQCGICGLKVSTRGALRVHIKRKHTQERPHKCNLCNKSFSMPGDLKKHERLHTGDRPYSCEHCHQRFTNSSGLSVHRRRKHPAEAPSVKCVLCAKKFPSKSYLKKHNCKGVNSILS